ncbi:hypothetical protein H5410_016518 [Solanum commersonii]|uniref:F-box domain-containing protein n=1 Tax=Solanum commersonii TaxID=4109 RepID=A0A9J5ZWL1_SOLCO|nr:hypothetical protein H5410_016518 [Solanum commersonii]
MNKLPDPLLVQILSLLQTEDAFRTCLVSTTWWLLLTLIHSFNFTCREREDLSFIHNAFAHSLSSKIIKFQLDLTYLRLSDCSFRPEYETLIDVQNCDLNKAVIAWNSLKSIKLGHLKLTDDDMIDLEILSLYIQHLEISRIDLKCRLVDVSSVVNAKLIFSIACIRAFPSIYVEEYCCNDYHQVVYTLVQDNLQELCYATDLTFGTWITQFNLYGVAGLLRASPHVETISIELETTVLDDWPVDFLVNSRCNSELLDLVKGLNMDLLSGVSIVEFHNLKEVKIVISPEW